MSSNARRDNWRQIHSTLMQLGCTQISVSMIEAVLRNRPTAAEQLLVKLYEFFTHRSLSVYSSASNKVCESDNTSRIGKTAVTCIVDDTTNDVAVDKDNFNVDDAISDSDRTNKANYNNLKSTQQQQQT